MPSIYEYERSGPQHRGHTIGIARHGTCAPFACNAPTKLCIEPNPIRGCGGVVQSEWLVVERCTHDGRVVSAWRVLPEMVDVEDDGA